MSRAHAPDFVIIGAMKSATSSLHEQLAAQPGFFMSRPKEPNFFSDDAEFARGLDWYRALFAEAPPDSLRGESSTHYTKLPTHPHSVARMTAALGKDLKLIYMMRHPVDRMISHYIHDWTERVISVPIDEAVDQHPDLIAYGCYALQLEPWLQAFGPERILPVFFDSFRLRPQLELERVGAFLGAPAPLQLLPERAHRNLSTERIRVPQWAYDLLTSKPVRWTSRRLFPKSWRARLTARWRMTERPVLSDERRAHVERLLDEDLARLGRWLNLPLDCRDFSAVTKEAEPTWTADAPCAG